MFNQLPMASAPPHNDSELLAIHDLDPDIYIDMVWQASTNLHSPLALDSDAGRYFAPERIVRNDPDTVASIVGHLVTRTIEGPHRIDIEQAAILVPTPVQAYEPSWLATAWRKALHRPPAASTPEIIRIEVWSVPESE